MPTLAELISDRKTSRGWSYRVLAARADDVLTAQRWQQLGTGVRITEFPEPPTLQAIADALEVDIATVVLAAAKSIGLDVRRQVPELAWLLPVRTDALTDEQRSAVLEIVRLLIANSPEVAADDRALMEREKGQRHTRPTVAAADKADDLNPQNQDNELARWAASRRVKQYDDDTPGQ